jgi:formate dehydrogenase subunit delta
MANQIADFFQSYPEAEAIEGISVPIHKFWDPRMCKGIFAHLNAGGAGLKPITVKALQHLAETQPKFAKSA